MSQRLQLRLFCETSHRCLSHGDIRVRNQVLMKIPVLLLPPNVLWCPLTSSSSSSGLPGGVRRADGSFIPASCLGSEQLRSAALHTQSQTAEGAVDLRMRARVHGSRL